MNGLRAQRPFVVVFTTIVIALGVILGDDCRTQTGGASGRFGVCFICVFGHATFRDAQFKAHDPPEFLVRPVVNSAFIIL